MNLFFEIDYHFLGCSLRFDDTDMSVPQATTVMLVILLLMKCTASNKFDDGNFVTADDDGDTALGI